VERRILGYGGMRHLAVFLLPATLVLGIVLVYPVLYDTFISFFHYSLLMKYLNRWVGLDNYIQMLTSRSFWYAAWISGYFTVVSVGGELVIGLFTALMLNRKFHGRAFVRSLVILPWALPTVVNGVMWRWIYDGNFGILNGVLYRLGLISHYHSWLASPFTALNMIILADIWKNWGFFTIVLLGALQTIPDSYFEAAKIDGSGFWYTLWHITIPLLKPAILVSLVMRITQAFQVFDIVYMITQGGPANGTQTLSYYIFYNAFQRLQFGSAATISVLMTGVTLVFALILIKIMYSEVEYM